MRCLSVQTVNDTYTLALLCYAYSLYGLDAAALHRVRDQLNVRAVSEGGMRHWTTPSDPLPAETQWWAKPRTADVEMTSYILLGLLRTSDQSSVSNLLPITRWLTTQRNAYGGFSSTQDTVVALQALSQFATMVYSSQGDTGLAVRVKGRGLDRAAQSFTVTNDNRLVQQTAHNKLRLPTNVTYTMQGSGCALVQVGVKFNKLVEPRDQAQPSFILSATIADSGKCKTQQLDICVKYNGQDERSNMAVVAVNMISGWIPDKASVYKLKNKAGLGLKRTDIDKNVVQLYFDEFDKTERCWSMNIEQSIEVSDTRSALVHVYDYYQPEVAAFVEYNVVSDKCPSIKAATAEMLRAFVRPSVAVAAAGPSGTPAGHRRNTTGRPHHKPGHKQLPCPACSNSSDTTEEAVCTSPNAYRVSVEPRSTMKLLNILRTTNTNVSRSIHNIKYSFHHRCSCSLLAPGNHVIVLTPGGSNNGLQVDAKNARRFSLSLRSTKIKILPDNTDIAACI
jgi:alpha-2-macroglobulin